MKSNFFLGIDIGTFESKGVIIDDQCRIIAEHVERHHMENPAPNQFEQDAEAIWWADFCKISKALLNHPDISAESIKAVGASALGADLLPVDKDCRPLRKAILYGIDARAKEEITYLNNYYGEDQVLEFNGRPLCSNDIPPKILWLKNNEPEIHEKAYKLITGSTYLTAKLTGQYYVDRFLGLGAFSPLYHPETLQPYSSFVAMFCREDQLAEVRDTTEIAGMVTKEASRETGLLEGTPVIVGSDDSAAEAISTGVVNVGDMLLQIGSSLYLIGLSSNPVHDKRIWSSGFIIPNTYAIQGGTNAAGTLTRWYRDNIFTDLLRQERLNGINAFESMMDGIEKIPPGSEGLLTLPYIAGERTPLNDPDAKGILCGLSIKHTRAHMYRSALESIGYSIAQHIRIFSENNVDIKNIYAAGGGSKNKEWLQIISDICGCNILTTNVSLGAAYGDAMMAAIGVGHLSGFDQLQNHIQVNEVFTPNNSNHMKYQKYFEVFENLYNATKEIVHLLK